MLLRAFGLRPGTGGAGEFHGGDGVVREIEALRPLTFSVLSERRAFQPYGLAGGRPGAHGRNLLLRADGRVMNLGGKSTVLLQAGDRLRLLTPGGGGFGAALVAPLTPHASAEAAEEREQLEEGQRDAREAALWWRTPPELVARAASARQRHERGGSAAAGGQPDSAVRGSVAQYEQEWQASA